LGVVEVEVRLVMVVGMTGVCWGGTGRRLSVACSKVGFGGLLLWMQVLVAVVGIWLCAVLMLIGVDGLGWWAAECLRSNVYGGGVCVWIFVCWR
jgi:hypothetical protein